MNIKIFTLVRVVMAAVLQPDQVGEMAKMMVQIVPK